MGIGIHKKLCAHPFPRCIPLTTCHMRQPNQSDLIYANQQILQCIEQNPIELETSSRSVWGFLGVPYAKATGFYMAIDSYDLTLCSTALGLCISKTKFPRGPSF